MPNFWPKIYAIPLMPNEPDVPDEYKWVSGLTKGGKFPG